MELENWQLWLIGLTAYWLFLPLASAGVAAAGNRVNRRRR